MVHIRKEIYERNCKETIVHSNKILWLHGKHIEEGLDHKHLVTITIKYPWNYRKDRYELVDEIKNHLNMIFLKEQLAIKVILDLE